MAEMNWLHLTFGAGVCWMFWSFFLKLSALTGIKAEYLSLLALTGQILFSVYLNSNFSLEVVTSSPPMGVALAVAAGCFARVGGHLFAAAMAVPGSSTSTVSSIAALYPIGTLILSILFLGEKITVWKILGLVFASLSAYCLSLG